MVPVSWLVERYLLIFTKHSARARKLSTSTQEDKQHERRRKQAKRVCHSQEIERSQTSQLGRDGAGQLVVEQVPEWEEPIPSSTTQAQNTTSEAPRTRKRRARHSQDGERRQTRQLGRHGARQFVIVEIPFDCTQRTLID